eukprot:gene11107-11188_t
MSNASLILDKIRALENELTAEMAIRSAELKFSLEEGKIIFEREIMLRHEQMKTKLWPYIRAANILVILTAPFIYGLIVPLVLLDLFVTVYQMVCFPVYSIKKVRRGDYLTFDRNHLAYLNLLEKINCAYCSYGNGIIAYAQEVAGLTEQYWCPIKHARRMFNTHIHYRDFLDFGDAEAYRQHLENPSSPLKSDPNT